MAENVLVNSAQNAIADTIEIFYTSPSTGNGTRITAFTASNATESSKSYGAYIYDVSASALPAIIPLKIIVPGRFDLGSAMVGHIIPPGGTLRMDSSLASSISYRVTGNEL